MTNRASKEKAVQCGKILWERYGDVGITKECTFLASDDEAEKVISFLEKNPDISKKDALRGIFRIRGILKG